MAENNEMGKGLPDSVKKKKSNAKPVKKGAKLAGKKPGKSLKEGAGKKPGKFAQSEAGKGAAKSMKAVMEKKQVRQILEYYYFTDREIVVRDMLHATGEYDPKSDIWPDLNLMEVEMNYDSLIFQDAKDVFIDPEDLAWLEEKHILAKYHMSFDNGDIEDVRKVMKNIMEACGGMICSNTDDFKPSYTVDTLSELGK